MLEQRPPEDEGEAARKLCSLPGKPEGGVGGTHQLGLPQTLSVLFPFLKIFYPSQTQTAPQKLRKNPFAFSQSNQRKYLCRHWGVLFKEKALNIPCPSGHGGSHSDSFCHVA